MRHLALKNTWQFLKLVKVLNEVHAYNFTCVPRFHSSKLDTGMHSSLDVSDSLKFI